MQPSMMACCVKQHAISLVGKCSQPAVKVLLLQPTAVDVTAEEHCAAASAAPASDPLAGHQNLTLQFEQQECNDHISRKWVFDFGSIN